MRLISVEPTFGTAFVHDDVHGYQHIPLESYAFLLSLEIVKLDMRLVFSDDDDVKARCRKAIDFKNKLLEAIKKYLDETRTQDEEVTFDA